MTDITRTLFILRHAQAVPSAGNDKQRALTSRGREDASALGRVMVKQGYIPDTVLCSSALRTQQTYEKIAVELRTTGHNAEFLTSDALYNTSGEALMHAIINLPPSAQSVLLIANNPGVHQLAMTLAQHGGESYIRRLLQQFAPATFCAYRTNCEDWGLLEAGNTKITDLMDPLDYNAPATPARWT